MTKEQLEKANELKNEIDRYNEILSDITYQLRYKKSKDTECKKEPFFSSSKWTLSKFFTFKTDKKNNKKAYLIPHYELSQGIEFDVEEDFVLMVKNYFEEKKNLAEQEFANLN